MVERLAKLTQPGSRGLLSRILDQPELPARIQSLPPATLGRLVDHLGLEDAGELVALATTEQLAHMLDEDVWRSERPGEAERFDSARLLVWWEVMLEAGDAFVAGKLAELPEDLVTLALHRHVLVLDLQQLAGSMQLASEDEARQLDKALESSLYEELGEYQVMARDPDGWDTVLAVILALDRDHHELLCRVLERCCRMASEYIDDNGGLYEVLTADQSLEVDLAAEREERRAERGYVAPATAASFLKLAAAGEGGRATQHDVVTRAYFRGLGNASASLRKGPAAAPDSTLERLVLEAGDLSAGQAGPLLQAHGASAQGEPMLVGAMRTLAGQDPRSFEQRSEELAYLTNVLVSGCSIQQRAMRPIEALRAVIGACSLGLHLAGARGATAALPVLRQTPADGLFRLAWSTLHQDLVARAAGVCVDRMKWAASRRKEDRAAFIQAASRLRKAAADGAPWRALGTVDMLIGICEPAEVDALAGLLDACPHLRGALGAELRFFAGPDDVEAASAFLERMSEST